MEFEKCGTCPLWEKDERKSPMLVVTGKPPEIGACHYRPPETKIIGTQMQSMFPMTAKEMYCMGHPKNKKKYLDLCEDV